MHVGRRGGCPGERMPSLVSHGLCPGRVQSWCWTLVQWAIWAPTSFLHQPPQGAGSGWQHLLLPTMRWCGLPWWFSCKESSCNAGDMGSIPGSGRCPGGDVATHSSILASRIPWAEKPGGLQSTRLQRVRNAWSDWAHTNARNGVPFGQMDT